MASTPSSIIFKSYRLLSTTTMSFGYAVGDIIAVIGLFERIAVELRKYRAAPAHFQQLSVELDLMRTTLKHVLSLQSNSNDESATLERIRGIVMHCMQRLQAMVDKMQAKEQSLGHFRTTRSLSSIGTRLHWSMMAQSDIEEVRKVILAEMVAINMLLSVQQLYDTHTSSSTPRFGMLIYVRGNIRRLSSQVKQADESQSALIQSHSSAIRDQTSKILSAVAGVPKDLADLRSVLVTQADDRSKRIETLGRDLKSLDTRVNGLVEATSRASATVRSHVTSMHHTVTAVFRLMRDIKNVLRILATCSKGMLEAIGRNTIALLEIASQMKKLIRAVEAIPLHLTLDIVRLDDALRVSWALPFQACQTWDSFIDILRHVVLAGRRPRPFSTADHPFAIADRPFSIGFANTKERIIAAKWHTFIKPGLHLEQSISSPITMTQIHQTPGEDWGDIILHTYDTKIRALMPVRSANGSRSRRPREMEDFHCQYCAIELRKVIMEQNPGHVSLISHGFMMERLESAFAPINTLLREWPPDIFP
ncbi:hypothetical protein F4778DRAFT_265730 [Xylariomycetidae sp. FL2044]|nr:hypothetical protein F4778DRAFT_265730 [Xylariomycetidae sp. FL2044]